jgi:hypothetical protein
MSFISEKVRSVIVFHGRMTSPNSHNNVYLYINSSPFVRDQSVDICMYTGYVYYPKHLPLYSIRRNRIILYKRIAKETIYKHEYSSKYTPHPKPATIPHFIPYTFSLLYLCHIYHQSELTGTEGRPPCSSDEALLVFFNF